MCVARDTCWTPWGIWSVFPKVLPLPAECDTLLKSGESSEVVWLIRSLRARIPGGLRPVDAVGPRGGEGHRRESGDQDSRTMSGDRASL